MPTAVLFVHGRSQASDDEIARDPERLAAYVLAKKRKWLAGLSKGLIAAGRSALDESQVVFPFYGNTFADAIKDFEANGGRRPELEMLSTDAEAEEAKLVRTKVAALLDAADAIGYDPVKELSYTDPGIGLTPRDVEQEIGFGDALKLPIVRGALQFLSRKTGTPALIIERFLDDVAYYLELEDMRDKVLSVVERDLRETLPTGGDIVVVGHSLGSIVAYDLLTRLPPSQKVRMLVTAGSPLGFPIVQKNLLGKQPGRKPAVPAKVPTRPAAWLNAYDVLDIVALVHPLAGMFEESVPGQLIDERTHNPTGPHAIEDYLADPDIAVPISSALQE
ncbi:hypothetical protein [Rhodococcus opacus]|uniref:Uncharacterized protein n=1 Tax=Rhodococcus opacus TaxID=37919 RepID=A0A076EYQ7_RHOOP|nr:hypothetical protein [Rhodococcus opacus]AII10558.1 hypothetical protein EP51_40640 [Rhodococcus opacus]